MTNIKARTPEVLGRQRDKLSKITEKISLTQTRPISDPPKNLMNRTGHRGRVDGNQKEIIAKLRDCGMQAHSIASVGDGIPDVLVGYRGLTLVLEVKEPGENLTAAECKFVANWPGQHTVVTSFDEAFYAVTRHAKECGKL